MSEDVDCPLVPTCNKFCCGNLFRITAVIRTTSFFTIYYKKQPTSFVTVIHRLTSFYRAIYSSKVKYPA